MPFELRVSPGEFLARVRGWGNDDFASASDAMRRLGEDPQLLPGMPVLMDIRELDYVATPPEVASFAAPDAMPAFFAGHRVAFIARRGTQFGVAKTFADKSERAGSEMEAFAEPDLAPEWLRGKR